MLQYSLSRALAHGDLRAIEAALNDGANATETYGDGLPPLRLYRLLGIDALQDDNGASYDALLWKRTSRADPPTNERLRALNVVLAHIADRDRDYASMALVHAVDYRFNNAVGELLRHGADPSWDPDRTALTEAVGVGNTDAIPWLVASGAHVDQPVYGQETPLMLACERGNVATVQALLRCGANISRKDAAGKTALDYAANSPDILAVLRGWKGGPVHVSLH